MVVRFWFTLAVLLAGRCAWAEGPPPGSWPQFRGDGAKTGRSPATISPPFTERWVAPIGLVNASPSVVGDTVYAGSYDGHLYALAVGDGAIRWKMPLGKPVYASPALTAGRLYVCCLGEQGVRAQDKQQVCQIFCLEATTGKVLWKQPLIRADVIYDQGSWAGGWASPVLDAKQVFVGSDDRHIYALDQETGKINWIFLTEGRVHSSPTLAAGTLFSGCHDGHVYALDPAAGTLKWKYKTQSLVNSTVAYYSGCVYFGSYDKHVYSLDARDGSFLWKTETDPDSPSHIVASPAVTEDAVFIGTWPGTMYGLERRTGKVLWRTPLGGRIQASSTVAGGVVYTLAHNRLAGLAGQTGKIVWEQRLGRGFATSTPTVVQDRLYVGSRAGLHCFAPASP